MVTRRSACAGTYHGTRRVTFDLLTRIEELVKAEPEPDAATWSHVEELCHVNAQLAEVMEYLAAHAAE